MNIYVSNNASKDPLTPFQVYAGTSDFASILNDMKNGKFPTGTGQPFPVNFASEDSPEANPMSPWSQNCTENISEPNNYEILGPKSLGL
jgi:hypothetical protein